MSTSLLELAGGLLRHHGVFIRLDGRPLRLLGAEPGPFALLGVRFGPAVDAVAIPLGGPGPAPVLAVERTGEAIVAGQGGGAAAEPPASGAIVLDLARRSLGLATATPDRPVAQLVDAVWLDRVLAAVLDAPLGEPPGWPAIARHHPLAIPGPPPSPEGLRHRYVDIGSWSALRRQVVARSVWWPPVSASLAAWFDDGSFARHGFAALADPEIVLADLHELLRPADAARVDSALSRG